MVVHLEIKKKKEEEERNTENPISRHAIMNDVGKHPAHWENTALQGSLVASA